MNERVSIVHDFDNTWTDSHEEVRPAMGALQEYLIQGLGVPHNEFMDMWNLQKDRFLIKQSDFGIRKYPGDKSKITAPLSSSVFELNVAILTQVLDFYICSLPIDQVSQRRRMLNLKALAPPVCGMGGGFDLDRIVRGLMRMFLDNRPDSEKIIFRPGLENYLASSLNKGFDLSLISNSPEGVVRGKIATRASLAKLVETMEANGKRVIGAAQKDVIDPKWNGKVDSFRGNIVFIGVPEKSFLTKLFRPIYMRRYAFMLALRDVGFLEADVRFAFGDCMENDLLLPHVFRATVGLMDHEALPEHERRWAEHNDGANVICSFEEASQISNY